MWEPLIQGCVAKNCHPLGCQRAVAAQIAYVQQQPRFAGPKRVLILGASSGFGLAARIVLAVGGGAETLGLSFERAPSAQGFGSAGWYNQHHFQQWAEAHGVPATSLLGDAFAPAMQQQVVSWIQQQWGQVDLLIYSLASGVRIMAGGERYRSVLKSIGNPVTGWGLDLGAEQLIQQEMPAATAGEIVATERVMGGDDWQQWVLQLAEAGCLAPGFRTLAFSYEGPAITHSWYRDGTLGLAKQHLQRSAEMLRSGLGEQGDARVVLCKALVTKASLFIPFLPVYLMVLMKVMKAQGLHEGCIEQMSRLFVQQLYGEQAVKVDNQGRWRLDERELDPEVQTELLNRLGSLNGDNFREIGDYAGLRQEFLRLNGFDWPEIDYSAPLSLELTGVKA